MSDRVPTYGPCRQQVAEILDRFNDLLDAVEAYQKEVEARLAQTAGLPAEADLCLGLEEQGTFARLIHRLLSEEVHDGLVRMSDRLVRLKQWQSGHRLL